MCLIRWLHILCSCLYTHSCVKELHLSSAKVGNTDGDDGADRDEFKLNTAGCDGHTALHLACLNGHFQVVNYLCTCGADLEAWYINLCLCNHSC